MPTFKAYLKKEALESIRANRYLILFLGTVFWALLDPLMLKLLPLILSNTLTVDMSTLVPELTRDYAFQNFMGDFFQISTLFFAFTLMGVISGELRSKRLVFPYSNGLRLSAMVMAKYLHYALTFSFFIFISFFTNKLYVTMLFEKGSLTLSTVFFAALLHMLYYIFLLAVLFYLSSIFKRGIIAGIATILFAYSLSIFNQLPDIRKYFPNFLLYRANEMTGSFAPTVLPSISIVLVLSLIFLVLTIRRFKVSDIA